MKHLTPQEAQDLLASNPQAVFVDCRSEMEYYFVGHPVGSQHVAWNDGPDWEINPHFVGQVKKVASMNRPVVLICRSGQRSIAAGLRTTLGFPTRRRPPSRASTLTPAATPAAWSSAILQVTAVVDALERRLDAAD